MIVIFTIHKKTPTTRKQLIWISMWTNRIYIYPQNKVTMVVPRQ